MLSRKPLRYDNDARSAHGYFVSVTVNGKSSRAFFSDRRYGGAAAAKAAAEEVIRATIDDHSLFLALRRRHCRRSNSPGEIPGVNRVPREPGTGRGVWVARWFDENGRRQRKGFRVSVFGEIGAYELALETRLAATAEERAKFRSLTFATAGFRVRHATATAQQSPRDSPLASG